LSFSRHRPVWLEGFQMMLGIQQPTIVCRTMISFCFQGDVAKVSCIGECVFSVLPFVPIILFFFTHSFFGCFRVIICLALLMHLLFPLPHPIHAYFLLFSFHLRIPFSSSSPRLSCFLILLAFILLFSPYVLVLHLHLYLPILSPVRTL
jgi:hypothetical protein